MKREERRRSMYDERLAERIRVTLAEQPGVEERKMFGGIAFMLRGHMCCGIIDERLMVRVGPEHYRAALAEPHAGEVEITGRPMTGTVVVGAAGIGTDATLAAWVERGVRFAASLPPKEKVAKTKRAPRPRARSRV